MFLARSMFLHQLTASNPPCGYLVADQLESLRSSGPIWLYLFEGRIALSTGYRNHYPVDNSVGFASLYPLDSDLSGWWIALFASQQPDWS